MNKGTVSKKFSEIFATIVNKDERHVKKLIDENNTLEIELELKLKVKLLMKKQGTDIVFTKRKAILEILLARHWKVCRRIIAKTMIK